MFEGWGGFVQSLLVVGFLSGLILSLAIAIFDRAVAFANRTAVVPAAGGGWAISGSAHTMLGRWLRRICSAKPFTASTAVPTFTTSWIATFFWLVLVSDCVSRPNLLHRTLNLMLHSLPHPGTRAVVRVGGALLILFLIWLFAIRLRMKASLVPSAIVASVHCILLLLFGTAACLLLMWLQHGL